MKEATGDLNMTVIIVIAVAGLMAFFSLVLWPSIRTNLKNEADCSDAFCETDVDENGLVTCYKKRDDGTITDSFRCPFKG